MANSHILEPYNIGWILYFRVFLEIYNLLVIVEHIKQFLEKYAFRLFIVGVCIGALVAHNQHVN
jgi:hypothetical protein